MAIFLGNVHLQIRHY